MQNSALGQDLFEYKAINGNLSVDEAKGIVECFVAAVGNKDSVGDIVIPGAFDASLKRRKPRVVWGHDWNQPIGKVLDIYEVRPGDPRLPAKMKAAGVGGLYARVQFNLKSERGREAFSNILFFGEDQEWSIGYKTLQADYDNNRQANILKELELYEVSPVLHGANQLTATISVKSEKGAQVVNSFRKSKWPVFDRKFAEMIKNDYPDIWDAGGNIKGDDQYEILTRIAQQGGIAETDDQVKALELREAWIARHEKDFLLPGVVAQIKWLAIGSRGQDHMKQVIREAISKKGNGSKGHYAETEDYGDDDGIMIPGDMPYPRRAAMALSKRLGAPVRLRSIDKNMIIADVMKGEGEHVTMRLSYHFEDNKFMFGDPEPVEPKVVYLPVEDDDEDEQMPDREFGPEAIKAPTDRVPSPTQLAPDAIPQERFTGDVLRGYGPRRGNLERLLRYWRPIMRREGGFRRCRVILADHPELYPLNNICAWLHHETTGLWPNEGCHHPGMKNCRRKLRGVVRGSLVSDSDFDRRMRELTPGKSAWTDFYSEKTGAEEDMLERMGDGEITDDDIDFANKVLREFMEQEKDFMRYIGDDDNWDHVGDDEDGMEQMHGWVKPQGAGGCGCGCGGKSAADDLLVKAGRVLSSTNMQKLEQAIVLLNEVIENGADASMGMARSTSLKIAADLDDLFGIKSYIDPIIEHYRLDAEVTDDGIKVAHCQGIPTEARQAIKSAVSQFVNNK